jgi:hypothetical protein
MNVWNQYNRLSMVACVRDSTATWTYASNTIRAANGSNSNRISFVSGWAEDGFWASHVREISTATVAAAYGDIGLALDSTTVSDIGARVLTPAAAALQLTATASQGYAPQLGLHFIQATEASDASAHTTTYLGAGSAGPTSAGNLSMIWRC